jgi:hypothetical protein
MVRFLAIPANLKITHLLLCAGNFLIRLELGMYSHVFLAEEKPIPPSCNKEQTMTP